MTLSSFARSFTKLRWLAALLAVCCGCAARRPASDRPYRLVKIEGTNFLLPPDFSPQSKDARETSVSLGEPPRNGGSVNPANCSIHDRWFSLGPEGPKNDWVARVPAPAAWQQRDLVAQSHQAWNNFLSQFGQLEANGCLPPESYSRAMDWLEESMPAPSFDAAFFRDPLGVRGFVALQPGMRLFIERSIFRTPGAETVKNYWGEAKVYYEVKREREGRVSLRLARVQRSNGLGSNTLRGFPDTKLAQTFHGMGALRLFLLTLYVPPSLKRNGLLVGVGNAADMLGILRKVEKNPEIPCRELVSANVPCATFEGMVSASVELDIQVNGKVEYFPAGTRLSDVARSLPAAEQSQVWKTLRIQRRFRGKLHNLDFSRGDPELPTLRMFAGDRIDWGGAASH